jgi:hypothetical protein
MSYMFTPLISTKMFFYTVTRFSQLHNLRMYFIFPVAAAATSSPCTSTSTVIYNITTLEQRVVELKRNLTLDTKNTSAYRRSLTCAEDSRQSSAYIGYLGIGLLSVTGGLFLCLDFSRLLGTNDEDDDDD